MTPQEELAALRRLAELEARAGGAAPQSVPVSAQPQETYDPAEGMSAFERGLVGAGGAARRAYLGVRSLIPGQGLTPEERDELALFERHRKGLGTAGTVGSVAADIAMTAIPAGRLAQGATAVAGRVLPRALAGLAPYAGAAASGAAVAGATAPEDRDTAAAYGAVGGALGQGIGQLAGRIIKGPVQMAPEARKLRPEVRDAASLGQLVDRNTVLGRTVGNIEEAGRSIPLVGSRISTARQQGLDAWRNNLINDVSPRGFIAPEGDGSQRLAAVYGEFRRRYGDALANQQISPSQLFESQVLKMVNDPRRGLTPEQADQVLKTVMGAYQARFAPVTHNVPAGTALATAPRPSTVAMDGRNAKEFESFLSDFARRYSKGQGPTDDVMGRLYGDIERAWTTASRRQMGPAVRAQINPLDQQYARYKTVEQAAGAVGNTAGDFTPAQLNMAVKTRTGQSRFGRGEGLLNREAQDAKTLFTDHMANSGTVDRAIATNAGGIAAMMLDPVSASTALATLGATTTRGGKNFMLGETAMQRLLQRLRADDFVRIAGPRVGVGVGVGEYDIEE